MLHNIVVGLMEKERAMNGEPNPTMIEAYDMIQDWQMERVAEIRTMQQMARE